MSENLNSDQFDYRMRHRAPGPDSDFARSQGHDLEDVLPDIHHHPDWYRTGDKQSDAESIAAIRHMHGRPDAQVTVYRAVPHGVSQINPGDWVSTSRSYAAHHGMHPTDPKQDWPVISANARADELYNEGAINEWGYHPKKDKP